MTADSLVRELAQRGIRLVQGGDRIRVQGPKAAVTRHVLDQVRELKRPLLELLAGRGSDDSDRDEGESQDRRDADAPHEHAGEPCSADPRAAAFREQLAAWQRENRPGIPVLALPGVSTPDGACISCGASLPPSRRFRCLLCVDAIHAVLGAAR